MHKKLKIRNQKYNLILMSIIGTDPLEIQWEIITPTNF